MDCDVAREALSARVDGEREPVPAHRVDEHVAGCAPCRDWQSALLDQTHLLRRLAGRSLVAAVPAPKEPAHRGRPRISWLRAALAVVGAVQLAVAVAQGIGLNLGMAHQHGAAAGHLMNESTAWSAALGVVMAATAFRPRLASGVAAVLVAYSAVLAVFVITDALAAAVTATRVLSHLPVLCGAVLALLMIRTADSVGPDPRSHADGGDADDDEADDKGAEIVLPGRATRGRRRHLHPTDGSAA